MRACAEEAKGSSTLMSAASERPSIAPFPTSKLVPGWWPIAATTSSRGSTPARRLGRADSRRRGPGGWAGSAAAAPAVRERSFIALRVIQSRNRKRTARKPNLSATARGSSIPASVELEGEVGDADRDPVAGVQLGVAHTAAVDLHSVRGPEVHGRPAPLPAPQLDVAPRDVRIGHDNIAFPAAADQNPVAAQDVAAALAHQQSLAPVELRLEPMRRAVGRVHHRVAEVPGRRSHLPAGGLLLRAAEQLRLDPELAELEAVVRVELDLGPAGQGEALLAAVLQQVVRQLLAEGRLVARELLAVLGRQEDAVVIGHVDAGDGDHLVVLHLLGELVRQLHRLHARLE